MNFNLYKILLFIIFLLGYNNILFSSTIDTLKPVNSIIIEENKKEIITGIKNASISPNGKYLGIVNQTGFFIALYDIDNGKLLKSFWTSDTLSDYFINKAKMINSPDWKNYVIIDRKKSESFGLDKSMLVNDFNNIKFLNDTNLIIGGTFRVYSIDTTSIDYKNKTARTCILNDAGYYIFNINFNIIKASIFENLTHCEFPLARVLFPYSDTSYFQSVHNYMTKNKDSAYAFTLFNNDGKLLKNICQLPKDYITHHLGYQIFDQLSLMCKVKDKFYWTSSWDYKIRNLFDTSAFEIKGFDTTNYITWLEMENIPKKEKMVYTTGRNIITVHLVIKQIDEWQDSLIAVYLRKKKDYVQFYDLNGNLKKHYVLNIPEKQELDYLVFDSKRNRILVITKDDENYHLLTYKVE